MFKSNGLSFWRFVVLAALLWMTACAKQPDAEMANAQTARSELARSELATSEVEWARAALQRNPTLELIATDERAGMFTVRDRRSGEIHAVALRDLAAAPVSQLTVPVPAPIAAAPAATQPEPAAADVSGPRPAQTAAVQEEAPTVSGTTTAATAATPAPGDKGYTIERTDGRLKISGPGISVVSAGADSATPPRSQTQAATEPIICEGRRMLQLDNRQLRVEGNAITVRGGCELYLTNSHIVASGVGVVVQDGTVHIANSYVEGGAGSFEADSQARVFVRGSTFQGLSRRDQLAEIQDQGGNRWR